MRLAEMCRKLETEHEKVLPFYTSSLTTEEQNQARAHAMETPHGELAKVVAHTISVLNDCYIIVTLIVRH